MGKQKDHARPPQEAGKRAEEVEGKVGEVAKAGDQLHEVQGVAQDLAHQAEGGIAHQEARK